MRNLLFTSTIFVLALSDAAAQDKPEDLVYRALSVRHPTPDCAAVEALTPTPVPTLLQMVDEAQQPPWVPMRAAECLVVRHPEEIRDRLDRWVVEPELRGLGLLVINRLDDLPLDLAKELAARAIAEGPEPEKTKARLLRLETPELRALGEVKP